MWKSLNAERIFHFCVLQFFQKFQLYRERQKLKGRHKNLFYKYINVVSRADFWGRASDHVLINPALKLGNFLVKGEISGETLAKTEEKLSISISHIEKI